MNGRQLAERMGIARSHVSQIEDAEQRGAVTLQTLERAAEALGCDLVYALVPKDGRTLEELVRERAFEVATSIVERVGTSMALEAQGVDDVVAVKRETERIASQLVRSGGRQLWD